MSRVSRAQAAESQRRTLEFIISTYRQTGVPPSFRECVSATGASGPAAIKLRINRLVEQGALVVASRPGRRTTYLPRVNHGCCPCCGKKRS